MKDDIWLKTHVESIAAQTTATKKQNILKLVSQTVHFFTIQRIIDGYSKTASLCHAAAATNDFAEIISEEDETEKDKGNIITEVVKKTPIFESSANGSKRNNRRRGNGIR